MMRKCISLTLVLLLVLIAAVPAFGAEAQSGELERAILKAKSVITIPEGYKEFNYSSYQSERDGEKPVTVWNLQWEKADGRGSIRASVDSLGNLNECYRYEENENSGLAKVSREAGRKTAETFLAKAMPEPAKNMRLADESNPTAMATDLSYTYRLFVNDIPVPFIHAEVSVDKYTGQVNWFFGLSPGFSMPQFPAAQGSFQREEAMKLYMEKLAPELNYYTYYDYEKKALKVFVGYTMQGSMGKAIDVATGQVVEIYSDNGGLYRNMDMGGGAMAKEESGSLSPEERAAIEDVSGLITKEKAEGILRAAAEGIPSGQKVTRSDLWQNQEDKDQFSWSVRFEEASGTVDARTGEVLSFYVYSETPKGTGITSDQAKQKAEAFLTKINGEKFAKTKWKDTNDRIALKAEGNEENLSYSFSYVRQENGMGVNGDGLSVTVNGKTGQITDYACRWHNKAVFPEVKNAMDVQSAFEKFNDSGNLGYAYKLTGENKVSLVYDFENSVASFLLNPVTGERIRWDGQPYKEETIPEYKDIKGHWAEKTIRELCANGYYIEGTSFLPDSAIPQETFLRYLYSDRQAGYTQEEFYKMLVRQKVVLAGEQAPDQIMTRQDAAKFMVRYLGFDTIAQKSTIFVNPFKDKIDSKYKGYAAICYGLEIMKGDEKGRFNGTKTITRAEAACGLYQLLEAQ